MKKTWILVGPDGKPYASRRAGTLGGHRGTRIYERDALAAGYRPCGVCLRERKKRSAKRARRN